MHLDERLSLSVCVVYIEGKKKADDMNCLSDVNHRWAVWVCFEYYDTNPFLPLF